MTLVLDEQLRVPGADGGLTVNAIPLYLSGLLAAGVTVASATSDLHNCATA